MGFALLALICAVALLGPLLALPDRLRLPVVIGELAVGLILGQSGFRIADPGEPTFAFLGQIGFALVMVVAGSHVPIRDPALRRGMRTGLLRAAVVGAASVPLGFGIAQLFGTDHGWLYAVLLASSSASLVLPALAGVRTDVPVLEQLLPQLAVADAVCIVLLPLAIEPKNALGAGLGALAVIAAALVAAWIARLLVTRGVEARIRAVSREHSLAIELRFWLVVVFAVSAIASALHVSVMLAGFACGIALAAAGEPERLGKQLFAITEGLFAPIFFVWLGASIDLSHLVTHPQAILLGAVLGLGALLVHCIPVLLRQPWPAAVVTAAQLGVPIAAVSMGETLGTLASGEGAAILLGAMITIGATTLASRRLRLVAEQQGGAAATGTAPADPVA